MTEIKNILITGGAGFIGSNLVGALLADDRIGKVRVLDNLSTGFQRNIEEYINHKDFEFIQGDICDFDICSNACEDIQLISHQAALGSVPRSIKDPITTNQVNIGGTLNVFNAAVNNNIEKVVFAASSSTYGDSEALPKVEEKIGAPLSPYAVTKYVNELYADVFSKTYQFKYIGLRYFNVFGRHQDPNGAYAAVIPKFVLSFMNHESPTINGDGSYSRDFTYIDNVIEANVRAIIASSEAANNVYNVAYGDRTTLIDLVTLVKAYLAEYDSKIGTIDILYGPERAGDIPHSLASIEKAKILLNYNPKFDIQTGLKEAVKWYWENLER